MRRVGHIKRTVKYVYIQNASHRRIALQRRRHTDGVRWRWGFVDCDADKIRWLRQEGMVLCLVAESGGGYYSGVVLFLIFPLPPIELDIITIIIIIIFARLSPFPWWPNHLTRHRHHCLTMCTSTSLRIRMSVLKTKTFKYEPPPTLHTWSA